MNRAATVVLTILFVLAGCSSTKNAAPPPPKPTIKSIAIVPATTPKTYSVSTRSPGRYIFWGGIAGAIADSRDKADGEVLTEKLAATKFDPGAEFTELVVNALRSLGYTVTVLESVPRRTDAPDKVNYEKVNYSADALLHVYFSGIALYSPALLAEYQPRMHAVGMVYVKEGKQYLYEDEIYYGVDVKAGQRWGIVADKKYVHPSFEAALNNPDLVREGFSVGLREIAKRMSEQVHAAVR